MTLIIAEAGVNHNGSIDLAKTMIDEAVRSKVDIIKFQTYKSVDLVTKDAEKAEYQITHKQSQETQFEMLKKLELDYSDFEKLKNYCDSKNIEFLSTAFDLDSLDFLFELGIKRIKISSADINNIPYLRRVASYKLPVILSTGMSNLDEVRQSLNILLRAGLEKEMVTILHCTTEYPAPLESVNLLAMKTIGNDLDINVGYSDHTRYFEIPIAAVAMGATTIEKHFTISRNFEGPDHSASLEPEELTSMVQSIRNIEIARGTGEKVPTKKELSNLMAARRSIVAKREIAIGEILDEENISLKRPADGLSPMMWDEIIGKKATKSYKKNELIKNES